MIIREATQEDFKKISKLSEQFTEELGWVRYPNIQEALNKHLLWVADDGEGFLLGFVMVRYRKTTREYIIDHIMVRKGYHRQGIGSKLLEKVPEPIELKVIKGIDANYFYLSKGLRLINTYQGKKHEINVYKKGYRPSILD